VRVQQIAVEALRSLPDLGVQLTCAEDDLVAIDSDPAVQAVDGQSLFCGQQQQPMAAFDARHRRGIGAHLQLFSGDADDIRDGEVVTGEDERLAWP
jgi:hypothetical protein